MNSLSVLFRDGSSSSYFLRKLFEFRAYPNSLDHSDCSHGVLAVFYKKKLFQKANLSPHVVLFLLTIRISDCLSLARIATRNQDEFIVIFISRRKFIFLFFEEAVRIWSLYKFSWSFGLQSFCCQVFCLVFLRLSFLSCSFFGNTWWFFISFSHVETDI